MNRGPLFMLLSSSRAIVRLAVKNMRSRSEGTSFRECNNYFHQMRISALQVSLVTILERSDLYHQRPISKKGDCFKSVSTLSLLISPNHQIHLQSASLSQSHKYVTMLLLVREAIMYQQCSFFEHCSNSLWPPPPLPRFEHVCCKFF